MTHGGLTKIANATQERNVALRIPLPALGKLTNIAGAIVLMNAAQGTPGKPIQNTAHHAIARRSAASTEVTCIHITNTVLAIPLHIAARTKVITMTTTPRTAHAQLIKGAALDRPG